MNTRWQRRAPATRPIVTNFFAKIYYLTNRKARPQCAFFFCTSSILSVFYCAFRKEILLPYLLHCLPWSVYTQYTIMFFNPLPFLAMEISIRSSIIRFRSFHSWNKQRVAKSENVSGFNQVINLFFIFALFYLKFYRIYPNRAPGALLFYLYVRENTL